MHDEDEGSVFVAKEPCPECGSRDNLGRYSDGHAWCYGCDYREPADDDKIPKQSERKRMPSDLLPRGKFMDLAKRKITEATCRKYGYTFGKYKGQVAHIAPYHNQDGELEAQHLRLANKEFPWVGDKHNKLQLFGQKVSRDAPTKIIITEGEIDALSVYEIVSAGRGTRWGVVSIISGCKGAKRDIAANLSWLEKAEEIILMLDNDEHGIAAANEVARMFKSGKCKIASLPLKDASDMLVAGRGPEVIDAIFGAKEYRPEGIVTIEDVWDRVLKPVEMGAAWWHSGLNEATYGRRLGELVALGAGTGVGKTDFLTQQIAFDIVELDLPVALFFLEQQPTETIQRLAGKLMGKRFHIPSDKCDPPWTTDELIEGMELIKSSKNLCMYDHFGSASYDLIEEQIRYLYHNDGVQYFYIDHLTALAATEEDERKALEAIMAHLGGVVKELDIWIGIISHLATPDGKPHEEGGRVMIRHFKGSRAIGFWCHYMLGLERNQQAEDEEERQTTTLRVLKDRVSGQATGKTFALGYEVEAGRLIEQSSYGDSAFGPIF